MQDTFSDPTSGWDSRVFEDGEIGYTDGTYRIFVKDENLSFASDAELAGSLDALRLEVEATQLAGTSGDIVGPAATPITVRNGLHRRNRTRPARLCRRCVPGRRLHAPRVLRGGDRRRPLKEENQLRIECVASPDGPTVLTLAANGKALVEPRTRRVGVSSMASLFVDTAEGAAEALFDDLVVTELVPR